jgi:hypothetical protein
MKNRYFREVMTALAGLYLSAMVTAAAMSSSSVLTSLTA